MLGETRQGDNDIGYLEKGGGDKTKAINLPTAQLPKKGFVKE